MMVIGANSLGIPPCLPSFICWTSTRWGGRQQKAIVALARRLAVIMHRMWIDGNRPLKTRRYFWPGSLLRPTDGSR